MHTTPEDATTVATVDERSRHELYLSIEELIGAERADTLMAMLPSVAWADVATKQDLSAHEVATRRDLAALEERIDVRFKAFEERIDVRFKALDARLDTFATKADLVELEARLERALRDQMRVMVFALIGALFTMTSLNLTATALLR
jgi:hypothetical protein